MFTGEQIVAELSALGITHVVWLPDSTLGPWEQALDAAPGLRLIRVCREGEAWALAAGLLLGGAKPLVMMQCTGLFESGDSLRNVAHDYGLPVFAIIGQRNALNPNVIDSARTFTEPILQAWGMLYATIETPGQLGVLGEHYRECQSRNLPGIVVLAEGRM